MEQTVESVLSQYNIHPSTLASIGSVNAHDLIWLFSALEIYGLTRSHIRAIAQRYPQLLTCKDEVLLYRLKALSRRGFSHDEIGSIVKKFPPILHLKGDKIADGFDQFVSMIRYDATKAKQAILNWPSIIGYRNERLLELLEIFESLHVEYIENAARFSMSPTTLRGRISILIGRGRDLREDHRLLFIGNKQFTKATKLPRSFVRSRDPGQQGVLQLIHQ